MRSPAKSKAERSEDVAAERRVHGAILGYQPMRMKPVHFATSFLLALTGRYHRLEILNKASVLKLSPRDKPNVVDEYCRSASCQSSWRMAGWTLLLRSKKFRTLRAHLAAAYNNDGAALAAAFEPYSTFGADYSAPSIQYISDKSKNHGHSGSFVKAIFEASPEGREALQGIRKLLDLPAPPLATFGSPLLDEEDLPWEDQHDEMYGAVDAERAKEVAARMHDATCAIGLLAVNWQSSALAIP